MPRPDPHYMGEVFTQARPAEDPVLYGTAYMEPRGDFPVRSLQSFRLTYTTGRYGLDDTGSIRIVFRFTADGGPLQTTDPAALNYVTATSSNGVPLRLEFSLSASVRPWFQALTIKVHHGYLREGDQIGWFAFAVHGRKRVSLAGAGRYVCDRALCADCRQPDNECGARRTGGLESGSANLAPPVRWISRMRTPRGLKPRWKSIRLGARLNG